MSNSETVRSRLSVVRSEIREQRSQPAVMRSLRPLDNNLNKSRSAGRSSPADPCSIGQSAGRSVQADFPVVDLLHDTCPLSSHPTTTLDTHGDYPASPARVERSPSFPEGVATHAPHPAASLSLTEHTLLSRLPEFEEGPAGKGPPASYPRPCDPRKQWLTTYTWEQSSHSPSASLSSSGAGGADRPDVRSEASVDSFDLSPSLSSAESLDEDGDEGEEVTKGLPTRGKALGTELTAARHHHIHHSHTPNTQSGSQVGGIKDGESAPEKHVADDYAGSGGEQTTFGGDTRPPPERRKAARRKPAQPRRSAVRGDPRFKGVTFQVRNTVQQDKAKLTITAYFNCRKLSRGRSRWRYSCVTTALSSGHCFDQRPRDTVDPPQVRRHTAGPWNSTGKQCASCGTRKTPLWRDAEDGTPLCNACGIRYKKYRVHCTHCWYIPKKDTKTFPKCTSCGQMLRLALFRCKFN